jgi:hypothetical protein
MSTGAEMKNAVVTPLCVRLTASPIFNARTVFEEIGAFPDMGALLAHCEGMLARV